MISWCALAERVHFWIHLLNCMSFCHKAWPVNRYSCNVFKKFVWFGKMGLKCRSFLIYQLAAIDQKPIMRSFWFFSLLKKCPDTIKKSKHHLLKISRSNYIFNLPKLVKDLHNTVKLIWKYLPLVALISKRIWLRDYQRF